MKNTELKKSELYIEKHYIEADIIIIEGKRVNGDFYGEMKLYVPFNRSFGVTIPVRVIEMIKNDVKLMVISEEEDELEMTMEFISWDEVVEVYF